MKKKLIIIISGVIVVGVVTAGAIFISTNSSSAGGQEKVYVDSISTITGMYSGLGLENRFSGVVEPQETINVKIDTSKSIKEMHVSVGQTIEAGTLLFEYDTDEMNLNLEQGKLDIERIGNEITATSRQIATLESEKASVSNDEKLEYTIQVQSLQNNIKKSEYDKKVKEKELNQLKKSIDNAKVKSSIAGVIKEINVDNNNNNMKDMPMLGTTEPGITMLATEEYRVKATTNEQNIGTLSEGVNVLARSRVDDNSTWTGIVSGIDIENPVGNKNNDMYGMGADSSAMPATKYNFYVNLDSYEGLMIGQHIFVEVDNGMSSAKSGVWLPTYYIVMTTEEPYIWVANSKDKLAKKTVTLGEYDETKDQYEIVDGISEADYIAFPDDNMKEGTKVIRNGGEVQE